MAAKIVFYSIVFLNIIIISSCKNLNIRGTETGENENRNTKDMRVICLDRLSDIQQDNTSWTVWSDQFNYAATGQDLPGVLQGKLEGDGIFYLEGRDPDEQLGMVWRETLSISQAPISLYLRYYGHVKESNVFDKIVVGPAIYYDEYEIIDKKLPETKNFTWGETMVEINPRVPFLIHFGSHKYDPEEYFLFDKAIITFGFPGKSIETMVELCP